MVDDEWGVCHHTGGVALAVGAGIGFIGRHTVVGEKLGVAIAVDDNATACAFHWGDKVFPSADEP